MFWIGTGSIIILLFSSRAYANNRSLWQKRSFFLQNSRLGYLLLQSGNLLLILAAALFLILSVVCHIKGLELHFSSNYLYHMTLSEG